MNVPEFMTAYLQQTAAEEAELARQEDAAAREARFAQLVERRSRFVFRVCYALLRNLHDAEDVVQEVFLKLYRSGAWERIEDEQAFLARTAWRIAQDKLRKHRSVTFGPDMPFVAASPEEAAIEANQNAIVHRLMDALPQELRQPLALSTVEELNSRQIAEAMGISEGTVRTRLMRARQILKQRLAALTERRYGN
jgi:RNA polymerase sigma-70 factor (ECF subfamily)